MKLTRLFFSLCFAITCIISTGIASVKPGIIVVKFKYNSQIAEKWLAQKRTGELPEFRTILGSHTSRGYINNATLQAVAKRENELNNSFSKPTQSLSENLSLICVFDCSQAIDVELLSRKISSNPNVEYAEPMPEHSIVFEPNDPQFLSNTQYNVQVIKATEAWDIFPSDTKPILLAIIDTGVDYNHEDLAPNIYINPGESGQDSQGRDKQTNNIDDDGNGFIDDWHGWDFLSSTSPNGQDNDPYPGHRHGTHCAGIAGAVINNGIGIAGTARYVRILPVKVARDNSNSGSIDNGYDGILYAASVGAKVISCSWGSQTSAESEREVITTAISLGALIVSASGNDGKKVAFFPAAYPGVISVTATKKNDTIAYFSNYDRSVDISAPGYLINSTVPNNVYESESGTSMAAPCVAGVAAMVRQKFPNYTPEQIKEQIKATADNIDSLNPTLEGYIGSGRINAYRAITDNNTRAVILSKYQIKDANSNGLLELDEQVEVHLTLKNILAPIRNLRVDPVFPDNLGVVFSPLTIDAGNFSTLEEREITIPLIFTVPSNAPENFNMAIQLQFEDSLGIISNVVFMLTVNPTYRTMAANNISVTFNSIGNIGFNDYPRNNQGDGFIYKKKSNLLFEGSLIIGTSDLRISNVARGINTMVQDKSFVLTKPFSVTMPGIVSLEDGQGELTDHGDSSEAGVGVKQNAYQFSGKENEDFVIVTYDITNTSTRDFTTLHAGLYFDWDIGISGQNNIVRLDDQDGFGYAYRIKTDTLPSVAVALLSPQQLNFFAADNDGIYFGSSISGGFNNTLKWGMLSNGIGRKASNPTDVSMVIGAGPMILPQGETLRVGFAIGASDFTDSLRGIISQARMKAKEKDISSGFMFEPLPKNTELIMVKPNITNDGNFNVEYTLSDNVYVRIDIINTLGAVIKSLKEEYADAGHHTDQLSINEVAQGAYFVRFRSGSKTMVLPLFVIK
ncbi:MAG: S8 family serine peptidase [Ignavibacteriae bacterium]|nr:S8 family serine peptidase [Ignavibacteriota bacterium]